MAYLSHDAWEAQLQGSKPRGSVLDSYNAGYDSYATENVPPPTERTMSQSWGGRSRRQSWASPSDALRERRMITPVSPLEEADAQFERRASVKAAHALKSDLEDLMRQGLKSVGSDAREAKAATDYLKGDMELRRREYQETQNKCQALELALESLRHESESKRDWFARRNAEKSEEEAWRSEAARLQHAHATAASALRTRVEGAEVYLAQSGAAAQEAQAEQEARQEATLFELRERQAKLEAALTSLRAQQLAQEQAQLRLEQGVWGAVEGVQGAMADVGGAVEAVEETMQGIVQEAVKDVVVMGAALRTEMRAGEEGAQLALAAERDERLASATEAIVAVAELRAWAEGAVARQARELEA